MSCLAATNAIKKNQAGQKRESKESLPDGLIEALQARSCKDL
jgi:hypothetical protein